MLQFLFIFLLLISSSSMTNTIAAIELDLIKHQQTIIPSQDQSVHFCENCDFFIGGLFPIHAPKSRDNNYNYLTKHEQQQLQQLQPQPQSLTLQQQQQHSDENTQTDALIIKHNCGEIKKERGIQRLEAMLYAIDLINNSTLLLKDIKLGAKIYDTCDRDTIALEKCMNFISDHFILNEENFVNDFICKPSDAFNNSTTTNKMMTTPMRIIPIKNKEAIYKRKVLGVIGAASSSVSVQVANILRLFQIPQISYASTSPELSNRERFPYFSRVLPSDTLQAEAMAILVKSLNWNYVATISEEGNLGGIDAFMANAKNEKICISGSYTLSQTASEQDVSRIVTEMFKQKNSRAVVMFLQDHNIKKLLAAVKSLNLSNHFLFVASDSWGTKKESIDSFDSVAEGTITFSPKSYEIKGFNEYFKKLKPKTNLRNPWFTEFWEGQFNCSMKPSKTRNKRLCSGEEQLDVTQDGFIHFVIDSVFAMAHAIEDLIEKYCKNYKRSELFKCPYLTPVKGPDLLQAIRNVEFDSITGRRVKFLKDNKNRGDGIVPFEVFQYQLDDFGRYHYQKIAEWDSDKDIFTIEMTKLKWRGGTSEVPRSVCKEECEFGEVKQGDTCCWVCVKCDETEYSTPNKTKCVKCPLGYGPNYNKTGCQKLPIEYMQLTSAFSLVPIIFSSLGIILTCYCVAIFMRFNQTPIIKASGRELCYVLLAGIMSCYLITFPLVIKPTVFSCLILRIGVSLSLTVCLSALFTKTNRLSRIFNNSIKKVRQASYVSPKSQLVICFSIISVQIVGILVWLVISPPDLKLDYDDPKRVVLQCKTQNTFLAISLFYNVVLVILCTMYAIKTRKIPENFNEARFIGFTMYSICVIWLAFIPIYFGTSAAAAGSKSYRNNYKIQLTTLAMCLSLSATVILACLFLPKLKVVLLKPNKNVRSKTGHIAKSSVPNTKETPRNGAVKDLVSVATANSASKTVVLNKAQKSRLGKFSFLWPNVSDASKERTSLASVESPNERTCLNKEFTKPESLVKAIQIKRASLKQQQQAQLQQQPPQQQQIQPDESTKITIIKNSLINKQSDQQQATINDDLNSNLTSSNSNYDVSITFKNAYADVEDSNSKAKNLELGLSKLDALNKVCFDDEDDEFFIVNQEARENYLKEVNSEDKVNDDGEEEEKNAATEHMIIFDGEKSIETTFNYFDTKTIFLNTSGDDVDDLQAMRITFV